MQCLVISPLARARICSPIGRKSQARDRADSAPPVMCPLCFRDARALDATSTAGAASMAAMSIFFICIIASNARWAAAGSGSVIACQGDRRNLPGQAPFVLAPAARTLLAAALDDRVPVAIRFGLVSGCDLKRERFAVFEHRSAVKPEARNAHHGKLDGQHVPFLPRRKSPGARCTAPTDESGKVVA